MKKKLLIIVLVLGGGVFLWKMAISFPKTPVDKSSGGELEERLVYEFGSSKSKLASFSVLADWRGEAWEHYCVLDYSSTEMVVNNYIQAQKIDIENVQLERFDYGTTTWSIVLLSEKKSIQIFMLGEDVRLHGVIGRCAPIHSTMLIVATGGDPYVLTHQ